MSHLNYNPAIVTITATLDPGDYDEGDYAVLVSNAGSGSIDWDTPRDAARISLYGQTTIVKATEITTPGAWLFGLAAYDEKRPQGNLHTGTPGEAALAAVLTPAIPTAPTASGYDHAARQVTLTL